MLFNWYWTENYLLTGTAGHKQFVLMEPLLGSDKQFENKGALSYV